MKRQNGFYGFFVLFIVLAVFLGCNTTKPATTPASERPIVKVPITDQYFDEVGGWEPNPAFQYYVSKTITMKLVEESRVAAIEGGVLVERNETTREDVVIESELPGIARSHQVRDVDGVSLNSLVVAFENYAGDPVLLFGPYEPGDEERYELLFADDDIVQYGHHYYHVNWEGSDRPYLLIGREEDFTDTSEEREASGLRLDE